MTRDDILRMADIIRMADEANIEIFEEETMRFASLVYAAGAAAERKRIINLLMIQHEMAQGRHNYYGHVALLIEADKGVANDT